MIKLDFHDIEAKVYQKEKIVCTQKSFARYITRKQVYLQWCLSKAELSQIAMPQFG